MPELPEAKRKRYESLGLSAYDANVMVEQMETALFYDEVLKLGADYRTANNLLVGDITAYLKEHNVNIGNHVFPSLSEKIEAVPIDKLKETVRHKQESYQENQIC